MSNARILADLMGTSTTVPSSKLSLVTGDMPSGSVLQVKSASSTTVLDTNSQTFADIPGMSVSITPTSATSKILITYVNHIYISNINPATNWQSACTNLLRDSTIIREEPSATTYNTGHNTDSTNDRFMDYQTIVYYDSPATTSAITYKLQGAARSSNGDVRFNNPSYGEGGTITVMEIAG